MPGDTIQEPEALVKECDLRVITSGMGEGRFDGPLHELFGRRIGIYRSETRVRFRRVQSEERIVVDWESTRMSREVSSWCDWRKMVRPGQSSKWKKSMSASWGTCTAWNRALKCVLSVVSL